MPRLTHPDRYCTCTPRCGIHARTSARCAWLRRGRRAGRMIVSDAAVNSTPTTVSRSRSRWTRQRFASPSGAPATRGGQPAAADARTQTRRVTADRRDRVRVSCRTCAAATTNTRSTYPPATGSASCFDELALSLWPSVQDRRIRHRRDADRSTQPCPAAHSDCVRLPPGEASCGTRCNPVACLSVRELGESRRCCGHRVMLGSW
jgi:hypothetical protein